VPIHVLKLVKKEDGTYDFTKVLNWTDEFCKGKVYTIIVTDDYEVILEPRKSTRPLDFGYVRLDSADNAMKLAHELESRYKFKIVEDESFSWDTERPPWVKIPT